jgi:hypothetical protein
MDDFVPKNDVPELKKTLLVPKDVLCLEKCTGALKDYWFTRMTFFKKDVL